MKILVLDASTTAIGWAILDLDKDHPEDLIECGLKSLLGRDLWIRLVEGREWLLGMMITERLHLVGVETPVVYVDPRTRKPRGATSTIKVAYMVGVLGAQALGAGKRVMEINPGLRLAAVGLKHNMRNPKPAVVQWANTCYSLDLDPKIDHDIADAIAIGWAVRRKLKLEENP